MPNFNSGQNRIQLIDYLGWLIDHPKYNKDIADRVKKKFGYVSDKALENALNEAKTARDAAKIINRRKNDSTYNLDIIPDLVSNPTIQRVQFKVNFPKGVKINNKDRGYTVDIDTSSLNKKELLAKLTELVKDELDRTYDGRKVFNRTLDIGVLIKITSIENR